jgi:AraC family transcriptional regulator of arabinose operon
MYKQGYIRKDAGLKENYYMENQSYYRIWDNHSCNEAINDRYITVNCTGCCVLPYPFTTHLASGRKDYYLLYLCKGKMSVLSNGNMKDMESGQFVVFYPDREYKYTRLGDEEVVYYWVHFTGYGAKELLNNCRFHSHDIAMVGVNEWIINEFNNIFTEFVRRDYCFEMAAASRLVSICINLSRIKENKATNTNTSNPDKIHMSIMFIHKNFNRCISVEQLAGMEHLSVSRYRDVFKKCTGFSPRDYIINLRIKSSI